MPRRGRMKIRSNLIKRSTPCTCITVFDAEDLAELITVPAMENGALFKTMFPNWEKGTSAQRAEVERWYGELLQEAVETGGRHGFLQLRDWEGYPLGFCGWTMHWRVTLDEERRSERQKSFPELLDCDAWVDLTKRLNVERDKALEGMGDVYRMTCTFVRPEYQRKGVGSTLLKWAFEHIDEVEMPVYLFAPPNAVDFYAKFGFEVVSTVDTAHGSMSTMFRKARLKADRPEDVEELFVYFSEVEESKDDGEEFKDNGADSHERFRKGEVYQESDDDCEEHWL